MNKLYKYSGRGDNKQQCKAIIEASMVYKSEAFTKNSKMTPGPSVTVKILVQENHSTSFLKFWVSNKRLMYAR